MIGHNVFHVVPGRFWPPAAEAAEAEAITGNIGLALLGLLLVWAFAALGEEIAYRGYLLARAADLGGGSTLALWGAMVLASILFGCGHYYKGPSGVVDSGVAGLILAHGFIDTFAVTVTYLGWRW